ncbi:patatin-like phospholipase family protein [Ectothiorhodospiraceae bacterium WFHF3C12]|nr:patatin-like phospholipase family protein [Ectothiorhodospiraceae bacterium WFHF3C12]
MLTGGGARAAYQVGVLKAIADILPPRVHSPFDIICGTSAGAINATALASHASRFRAGVRGLEAVWMNFHVDQVYRTDFGGLSRRAMKWLGALFFAGLGAHRPDSLLDNSPLRELLDRLVRFDRIQQSIDEGDLRALSITASGYSSGHSVSFFQGVDELDEWERARRLGVRSPIGLEHLMASSAIPALFPAVKLHGEYFGDGSVRQLAPISPALHLGADRVLVIANSAATKRGAAQVDGDMSDYPSIAQIAGHVLNSAFLDSLDNDLERLERINRTLSVIPERVRRREEISLRPVETLTIRPSEEINVIATEFEKEMPRSMRFFLRGSGVTNSTGSVVMSYLLFERGYCRALINLGYSDTLRQENRILRFLGFDPKQLHGEAANPPHDTA